MQPSPEFASIALPMASDPIEVSRHLADRVYQVVTIAAMLLLLGSLWVF